MVVESEYSVKKCAVLRLFVSASQRGQGLGSQELRRIEGILKENQCKWAYVYVGSLDGQSIPASEFYRKNGYVHICPNKINLMTQMFGFPKNGVPQGGMMCKPL